MIGRIKKKLQGILIILLESLPWIGFEEILLINV